MNRCLHGLFAALAALVLCTAGAGRALAADVVVAVAANFTEPVKEIAARFTAKTGDQVVLTFGASGQLYTQISHGAPFQVFLSADADRPKAAEHDGFAVPGSRFTYATGRLVLYSATPGLVDADGAVLARGTFQKLAIADPATAPYGVAAVQTLTALKLDDQLKPKIVQGTSITQAFQFVQTGAAELGFVALSQVIDQAGGSRWVVPEADHDPIDQQAVLLKTAAGDPAASAFIDFLKGPEARAIIKRYGYEVH